MGIIYKTKRVLERLDSRINSLEYKECASDVYAEGRYAKWTKAYSPEKQDWPLPLVFGKATVSFTESLSTHFPAQGVCEIENGRLVGPFGLAFGPDKTRLPWHSWHRDDFPLPIPVLKKEWRRSLHTRIKGRVLSLMSEYSATNYCHFLMDSLSRIHLAIKTGLDIDSFDAIVLPGKKSNRRLSLLEQFGIPADKVVWYNDCGGLSADHLFVTTFPGRARCYPNWAVSYIAQRLAPALDDAQPTRTNDRKLYVSRAGFSRDLENIDELLPLLKQHNYEVYQPENSDNPAADFAESRVVIGAHGAGLTDMIFSPPGGFVLELVPERHIFPYYYTLAIGAGHKYGCILGRSPYEKNQRQLSNFYISPEDLSSALEAIDSASYKDE